MLVVPLCYSYVAIISISAEPINVGWGKKATQFHGSEGKQAALQTSEVQYILALPGITPVYQGRHVCEIGCQWSYSYLNTLILRNCV